MVLVEYEVEGEVVGKLIEAGYVGRINEVVGEIVRVVKELARYE